MKLICCNFKMNLLKSDIINYLNIIDNKINKNNIIFLPSIPYISYFNEKGYQVGSQNISFKEFGNITGDISILQLKELGIKYTMIGHSEVRQYFNDDNYIEKKIKLALDNNIKVILCIGETKKIDVDNTYTILKKEINDALLDNKNLINNNNLIIAYEPIWTIGKEIIPSINELKNIICFIKEYVLKTYNLNLKVLYGGSVNLNSIDELEKIKEIDGYLIGNFSLKPENILSLSTHIM